MNLTVGKPGLSCVTGKWIDTVSGAVAEEMLHSWVLMPCLPDVPPIISGGTKKHPEHLL